MNLRDLDYLVAVAKYRHFKKAADACFVSQPALSMQLQKLEETLGVRLFERSNKHVMITPVGQEITNRAQKILQEVHEIKETAKSYQNPFSGTLTLGAFPTLAPYFLPDLIPLLVGTYPQMELRLVEEKTDILIEKLKNGGLDAAFLALPIRDDALEYAHLFDDEFLFAISPSHSLSQQPSVTRDDLKNEHLLLLEDGHCLRDQALDVCSLIGTSERHNFQATSLETLRQMVAANSGSTLIPTIAKKENDGLIYLPFKSAPPSRSIALVWRKASARKKCFNGITEVALRLKGISSAFD